MVVEHGQEKLLIRPAAPDHNFLDQVVKVESLKSLVLFGIITAVEHLPDGISDPESEA